MKVLKTTRLAGNPHRKRNRKLTPRQIKFFGTKRQRAALKSHRKRTRKNAAPARAVRPKARNRAKRSPNPLVLHLKPLQRSNPKRRTNTVAKANRKRKRPNAARRVVSVTRNRRRPHRRNPAPTPRRTNRRRHHRRNPTRIVVMAPRRQNRHHHARRNPTLFGNQLGSKTTLKILGGGLIGVAATKFIPTLIPGSLTGAIPMGSFGPFVISGISAMAAWFIASKLDASFGEGVLFGGLMQTASVALNAFLPNLMIAGVPIALGDLVEGRFVVPQNPLRNGGYQRQIGAPTHSMAPTGSKVTTSGLGRAYPSAY